MSSCRQSSRLANVLKRMFSARDRLSMYERQDLLSPLIVSLVAYFIIFYLSEPILGIMFSFQSLVIRERVVGPAHIDVHYYLRYRGAIYCDTSRSEKCFQLWLHALHLQQQ